MESKCPFVALSGCQFRGNYASKSGGAIFADDPTVFRYQCLPVETKHPLTNYNDSIMASMKPLQSKDPPCEEWSKNKAAISGWFSASTPRSKKIFEVTNDDGEREIDPETYSVSRHRSGTPLRALVIQLEDVWKQSPAFETGENSIPSATMQSKDKLFDGKVTIDFAEGKANFSDIIGFGKPSVYTVNIDLFPPMLGSISYNVTISLCGLGEQSSDDGKICYNCTYQQYSLSPEQNCTSCPRNGNCSTHIIHPLKGYFHRTPCSTEIKPCLSSHACAFEKRQKNLEAATNSIKNCTFDDDFVQKYNDAQCNTVKRLFPLQKTSIRVRGIKDRFVGPAIEILDKRILSHAENVKVRHEVSSYWLLWSWSS